MKKPLRIAALAWLIPTIAGCAGGGEVEPTITEPGAPPTMDAGVPVVDTVPSGDAMTTASDSTGNERGGGSYGSGH
jgi:hypothetical protein